MAHRNHFARNPFTRHPIARAPHVGLSMTSRLLFVLAVALALFCLAPRVQAQDEAPPKVLVTRPILLPDGKPAAGARVSFRFCSQGGSLDRQRDFVADAAGVLTFDAAEARLGRSSPQRSYVVVDAEGAALTFLRIFDFAQPEKQFTLRLRAGHAISGTVKVADGAAVGDAKVALDSLSAGPSTLVINSTALGITTTGAATTTAAAGAFRLRPIDIILADGRIAGALPRATIGARASVAGETLIGAARTEFPWDGAGAEPTAAIALRRSTAVSGTVGSTVNDKPAVGAKVSLYGYPDATTLVASPVETDEKGAFAFKELPADGPLYADIAHSYLASGRIRMDEASGGGQPSFANIKVALPPWSTLEGSIVLKGSNAPPAAADLLRLFVESSYSATVTGPARAESRIVRSRPMPDGNFSLRVPTGKSTLGIASALYEVASPLPESVPASGAAGVVLTLEKKPVFYIAFQTDKPAALRGATLFFRQPGADARAEDKIVLGFEPFCTLPAKDWGERLEIRVVSPGDEELLPWTAVAADKDHWPRILQLP